MNGDQDPYFVHYYRIGFDGKGLTKFTEANGTHTVTWSPDRKYYVDSYSRVDLPTVTELRRVADGAKLPLETGDMSAAVAAGFRSPEVIVSKARDGKTDIWGIIVRPLNFDAAKKYPVIEQIYAGPQGSFVPKTWGGGQNLQATAELGFIMAQVDGLGTSNRSKAFHDVAWQNLADAGFPDRILWHQAAAAKYPWYDMTRVGVYALAGGQNAAGGVLLPCSRQYCSSGVHRPAGHPHTGYRGRGDHGLSRYVRGIRRLVAAWMAGQRAGTEARAAAPRGQGLKGTAGG
jgi:hypothetical protein